MTVIKTIAERATYRKREALTSRFFCVLHVHGTVAVDCGTVKGTMVQWSKTYDVSSLNKLSTQSC